MQVIHPMRCNNNISCEGKDYELWQSNTVQYDISKINVSICTRINASDTSNALQQQAHRQKPAKEKVEHCKVRSDKCLHL